MDAGTSTIGSTIWQPAPKNTRQRMIGVLKDTLRLWAGSRTPHSDGVNDAVHRSCLVQFIERNPFGRLQIRADDPRGQERKTQRVIADKASQRPRSEERRV